MYQLPPPTAVPYDAVTKLGKPLAVQAFEPDAPLNPQQHPSSVLGLSLVFPVPISHAPEIG